VNKKVNRLYYDLNGQRILQHKQWHGILGISDIQNASEKHYIGPVYTPCHKNYRFQPTQNFHYEILTSYFLNTGKDNYIELMKRK